MQMIAQPMTTETMSYNVYANGVTLHAILPRDIEVSMRPVARKIHNGVAAYDVVGVELVNVRTQEVVATAWKVVI